MDADSSQKNLLGKQSNPPDLDFDVSQSDLQFSQSEYIHENDSQSSHASFISLADVTPTTSFT